MRDEWMSARQAAEYIGVTVKTIHAWRQRNVFAEGAVKHTGILQIEYQFRRDEVERVRKQYRGNSYASAVSA